MSTYGRVFKKNWSYKLFVGHAELFLPILEEESRHASAEVSGLLRVLRDLKVDNKSSILDLSCGIGRHSIQLSRKGYRVIGYDPSKYYIRIARQNAELELANKKNKLVFYIGEPGRPDLKLLPINEKQFGVIMSMFQSIGYISRAYDLCMFKNLLKISSNQCFLILETENRDWRLRNFEENKRYDYGTLRIVENWQFDPKNNIFKNKMKVYTKGKNNAHWKLVLDIPTYMILYSLDELKEITRKAGWKYLRSYHSIRSLNPASIRSKMPVSVFTVK